MRTSRHPAVASLMRSGVGWFQKNVTGSVNRLLTWTISRFIWLICAIKETITMPVQTDAFPIVALIFRSLARISERGRSVTDGEDGRHQIQRRYPATNKANYNKCCEISRASIIVPSRRWGKRKFLRRIISIIFLKKQVSTNYHGTTSV